MNSIAKNTSFFQKRSLNLKGRLFEFDKPLIMGILNLSEDSFFKGSHVSDSDSLLFSAEKMLADGADILDIGGMSTRPGAHELPQELECERLAEAIELLANRFPQAIISVDTYRSQTALAAIQAGAQIVNDISAGNFDSEMYDAIAPLSVPYIMMHTTAKPAEMQQKTVYNNLLSDINMFFAERIAVAKSAGIVDIIIDPGFGFGKTLEQNYELMAGLSLFQFHNLPVLVGISRKSMIYKLLNNNPEDALSGTIALNTFALLHGASILRVHDVLEAKQLLRLVEMLIKHS